MTRLDKESRRQREGEGESEWERDSDGCSKSRKGELDGNGGVELRDGGLTVFCDM